MKAKYLFTTADGSVKEIYVQKSKKSYVAFCDGKAYRPLPNGTVINFNGSTKTVDSRVIFFDVDGVKFFTYPNNWAAPVLTAEKDTTVKSNKLANNLKVSFPLLVLFIGIVAAAMILAVVAL